MKLQYSTPRIERIALYAEGIIADSLPIGTTPGGTMGSQEKGWSSEVWSQDNNEWEE